MGICYQDVKKATNGHEAALVFEILLKGEILLMQNLFLSLYTIRRKDVGTLGRKATPLADYYGSHQLQGNYFI